MSKVADWLLYARNDLRTAQAAVREGITNTACLHSHQVAEKSLKAVLLLNQFDIPMRYPDALPGGVENLPTQDDCNKAIAAAEEIFKFVESKFS